MQFKISTIIRKNKKQLNFIIFLTIIVLGFYLRFQTAIEKSFVLDETSIFKTSQLSLKKLILMEHWDKIHPQLFYIFIHFWSKINTTAIFLRIPTIISFIPAAILVFLIGKNLKNHISGLISAFIFSIHPFFVNLGFQQKMYGFEIVFMLTSLYSNIQIIKTKKTKKWIALAIISNILAFFTDYSFIWYFIALTTSTLTLLFFTTIDKKKLLTILKTILITTLIISVQAPIFFNALPENLLSASYLGNINFSNVQATVELFIGAYTLSAKENILNNYYKYFLLCLSIFLLIKKLLTSKHLYKKMASLIIINSFFISLSLSFIISQISPIFIPHNIFCAAFILIFGIPLLIFSSSKNRIILSIIFILITTSYFKSLINSSLQSKQFSGRVPWKTITMFINKYQNKKTIIFLGKHSYKVSPLRKYYFQGYDNDPIIKNYDYFYAKNIYDLLNKKIIQSNQTIIIIDKSLYVSKLSQKRIKNKLGCTVNSCHYIRI